jgi:zinc/manganese transport system substrate-binding protein
VPSPSGVAHAGLGELLLDLSLLDWHCHVDVSRLNDNDSHYRSRDENRKMSALAQLAAAALCLSLGLAACADSSSEADDGLRVVATTSILGDIAAGVVGDEGEVDVLIPIGVDAHAFSPSSQQASMLAEADLVVANGLGLEAGLEDVLASVANDGVRVLELAPLVEPIEFRDGGLDPHFWMDPVRVGDAALVVASALEEHHPGEWPERAASFEGEMKATDLEIEDLLSSVPQDRREMVTNHEAFGYFAHRYGFEIIGVVIPGGSTLAEPSSAELADLVEVMQQSSTGAIFAETTQPRSLAEAVAAELGDDVEVVELFTESLGGPGSGAETLQDMLVTNARRISEALG